MKKATLDNVFDLLPNY